jgi:uncharacterized protein (DUF58 family)
MMAQPLLERAFLEQLERLTLHWKKSFPGLVGGHNISRFAGAGQEFLEHRNFHQGDDLRAVNWRAYMRFEKLFLKMFQIEPRVPVRILLDVSSSMLTGHAPQDPTKLLYSLRLAASLVYVGLVRLDSILLQPFASSLYDPFLASGGRHRFQPAETFLRSLTARGGTDFFEAARQYLSVYPQRGLAIVISDFLSDADPFRPLQYLADFGHELYLVQLWGEEDRTPAGDGEMELVDAESQTTMRQTLDDRTRDAYTASFDEYSDRLRKLAMRNGGRYAGLSTHVSLSEVMFGSPMLMEAV